MCNHMKSDRDIIYLLHLPRSESNVSDVGMIIKESRLINYSFNHRYVNLLLSRSVEESGKINILKMLRVCVICFQLFIMLIQHRPNLCYYTLTTSGKAFYKDCILIFMIHIFRIRIIYHLQNKRINERENKKINDALFRFIFRNSFVILLSKILYDEIEKYVCPENVYFCPYGINDYQIDTCSLYTPDIHPLKILYVSDLIRANGVYDLIDACALLMDKGYRFRCDFVGNEGDVSEALFNAYVKQKGMVENVRYLGTKNRKQKGSLYEQADIFVLPTWHPDECFPLVILEAMQHSLPVISTYEGAIPEIIDDQLTGFLIPQHDVTALSEKLELLLRNPILRMQLGSGGRIKYENNFTRRIFEQRILAILEEVI